jgi:hypothetical protein
VEARRRVELTSTNRSIGLIALIIQCPSLIRMRNRPKRHLLHCCALPAWWPSAKRSDPIPSRTRPSNASAPMVLCLKTWESRSSPGLQCTIIPLLRSHPKFEFYRWGLQRISLRGLTEHKCVTDAGWSSPVARQAHNLKVVSSNLAPATKSNLSKKCSSEFVRAAALFAARSGPRER